MANEKTIAKKQAQVDELAKVLKDAKVVLLTDYRGITVTDVTKLRADLRNANAEYKVIKNNIIKNIITWIVVVCGFVMFRADSVGLGLTMLKTMFTGFNMEVKSISFVAGLLSPYYIFVIIMAIIFAYPLRQKLENTISKKICIKTKKKIRNN